MEDRLLPFASLSVQQHIVASLDKLSMEVQQLEKSYQQRLESLDELKKSLLQKAFSGELTKSKGIAV
jgi:type I restriction enzyme S subunit